MENAPEWTAEVNCANEQETAKLANRLALYLQPGTTIGLNGPLGSGKTSFARAFATALGVDASAVNSPTYVIVQHYLGDRLLHHFDLYRLKSEDELFELGADDLFEGNGICLVEWSNRFPNLLPEDRLEIKIEVTGENSRRFLLHSNCSKVSEQVKSALGNDDE